MAKLKKRICAVMLAVIGLGVPVAAQEPLENAQLDTVRFREEARIGKDTLRFTATTPATGTAYELLESMPVSASIYRRDWIIFFTGGMHTFRGDYSNDGDFSGTLSPEISGGIGYWFNPYVGLAGEFIRSESEGYSEYITGHYGFGYGEILEKEDGTMYRKMKTSWWDASLSVMLNLTRLINGYEGYGSLRNRNQFILNLGMGCVHHLNYHQEQGTGYNWSGHAELQYSRFFGRKKRFSLDVKLRCLFYHTNFDYESKRHDRLIDRIDGNVGIHAGFTLYLGRLREKKRIKGLLNNPTYDYSRHTDRKLITQGDDIVGYRTITTAIDMPTEKLRTNGNVSAGQLSDTMLQFQEAESARIFKRLTQNGIVTQVDLDIPDGNPEAEDFAHAVEAWLKGYSSFQNAMYQTFKHKLPDSGKDILKIRIHYLMQEKKGGSPTKQSI